MRLIGLLILLLFVVLGVLVGALNADPVRYDLAFAWIELPKGVGLLVALVIGWLLGGLTAWLGMSISQRRGLRRRPGKTATSA